MAKIYNSDLTKELIDVAKIQTSRDKIPDEVAEKVVPVIDVNPKHARIARVLGVMEDRNTSANGVTLMTTEADRDTYITGVTFANTQDALCDNVGGKITYTDEYGTIRALVYFKKQTTTAGNVSISREFTTPLKCKRSSTIFFVLTFAAGNSSSSMAVYGYTDDTSKS